MFSAIAGFIHSNSNYYNDKWQTWKENHEIKKTSVRGNKTLLVNSSTTNSSTTNWFLHPFYSYVKGEIHRSALFRKETALWKDVNEAASSSSASFSHFGGEQRRAQDTCDCLRSARDHGKKTDNRQSPFLFLPSFASKFSSIERRLETHAVNEVCSFWLTPPQGGTFPHDVITIVSKHFDKSLIHEVRFDQHP